MCGCPLAVELVFSVVDFSICFLCCFWHLVFMCLHITFLFNLSCSHSLWFSNLGVWIFYTFNIHYQVFECFLFSHSSEVITGLGKKFCTIISHSQTICLNYLGGVSWGKEKAMVILYYFLCQCLTLNPLDRDK